MGRVTTQKKMNAAASPRSSDSWADGRLQPFEVCPLVAASRAFRRWLGQRRWPVAPAAATVLSRVQEGRCGPPKSNRRWDESESEGSSFFVD